MKLTFLVTCFNQQEMISKTIDSLINQTQRNDYQILISDDMSTDNSFNYLVENYQNKYSNIKVISTTKKLMVGNNRNNLIENCDSDYAMFIDGDDVQSDKLVEKIFESIKTKKSVYHLKGFKELWDYDHIEVKYAKDYENVFLYVFQTKILKEMKFNTTLQIGEDFLFSIQYYELLNNQPGIIDYYYLLNRQSVNISLTKNGKLIDRLNLEKKLLEYLIPFEHTNPIVNGKINQKKIDIINFSILTKEPIVKIYISTKNIRIKHKISYFLYLTTKYTYTTYLYHKLLVKKIGFKI